ncbi:MAG TPA: helix-turn-helix domain-containing protein [Candidatus Anaerofilum faecale]|nr:helix-turn-helix transcriptional regulator [Anaerofilum sp. An201]OUP04200.1 transcriptional regulator [Anaerofilum sp. An201]HIX13142.1 helix-turn-helix domain-containing protein [Candidatus Anaerofilum faecale]
MLSTRIKELRVARNLSQVQMAKLLGVTKQSISNWENNNIQPSVDMLVSIARLFSVSTDYLLCLDDRQVLDVSGLSPEYVAHIQQVVDDMRR